MKRNLLLITACAIISVYAILRPVHLTYHANVETESIDLRYCGQAPLQWDLQSIIVQTTASHRSVFTGTILFKQTSKTIMSFTRIGHGELEVLLRCEDGPNGDTIADLYNKDNNGKQPDMRLVHKALLLFPKNQFADSIQNPIVIPLIGTISVGREPRFGAMAPNPRLFSGRIDMRAHSLFGKDLYEAGGADLHAGDWFSTGRTDTCIVSATLLASQGLLTVTDGPGIDAMVDFIADKLEVQRYRAQGYSLQTSLWTRVSKDPFLQGVWVAFIALWGFGKVVFKREQKQK